MDHWLQLLIAAACIVIIGAGGVWLYQSTRTPEPWQTPSPRDHAQDCRELVAEWDDPATDRSGMNEGLVTACRWMAEARP